MILVHELSSSTMRRPAALPPCTTRTSRSRSFQRWRRSSPLDDKIRYLDAILMMTKDKECFTGWKWVRYSGII